MKTPIFKPLTEEKKCMVRKFFNEWVTPDGVALGKLFLWYWRMRATEKIQGAEEMIEMDLMKKQDAYRWRILGDMKRWLEDIKYENGWYWNYKYELANIKQWADGRTMLLWFQDTDMNWKLKWRKWVLIEENKNPKFFKEMLEKYQPKDFTTNKPF